jgi:kynurenine formamidase
VGHFISDERVIRLGHQLLCVLLAAYDFPNLYRASANQFRRNHVTALGVDRFAIDTRLSELSKTPPVC